jgi:hypothetical protein
MVRHRSQGIVDTPAFDASLEAIARTSEVAMPTVTIRAKRQAIAKAYGCYRVEDLMDDFYYARRHLAKLP